MNRMLPVGEIKGVGPKTAELLMSAGFRTVNDLIYFLPRTYEDFSQVTPIGMVKPGKITVRAKVENIVTRRVKRGMHITEATLVDASGKMPAVWFNQSYRAAQLKSDGEFFMSGEFGLQYKKYQLTNPSVEKAAGEHINTDRVLPIYREVKGLKSHLVRKLIDELRPVITMLPETLPEELVKREKLLSHADALLGMHFPKTVEATEHARHRLGFEELFELTLASALNKQENNRLEGWHIPFNTEEARVFVSRLPFKLTNAQRLAAWDILQNFETAVPMNRLLQGDVGSGKTVVAGFAAYMASLRGFQTALMAPTEILATQHAATLRGLLEPFGVEVALLTGSVPKKAKEVLREHIVSGAAQIVVGTHALIQDAVQFHKLGFVVIDEQHRFGVEQRQKLLHRSAHMPHLLAMTATPIPRSLALTVYGELDVSVLNERPEGRLPIKTKIWSPNSRAQLYEKIETELIAGRQAYVVCPLIDESPDSDHRSVEAEFKRLRSGPLKHRRISLLHGQLKSAEKEAIMATFVAGESDILVSTTVIEVGVDVPNATVMMIESADRFGLAQLHQLRGRVGRSHHQSYCFLVPTTSAKPSQRLRELENSNDGFYLAEVDLKLRGPGEIYGRAQHGALDLKIASLADTKTIAQAQKAALWFIENGFDLIQYKQLQTKVRHYQRVTTLN
jgi:ATP-dependent DNA helicase RecG